MSDPLDALPPGSQVTPWHVCRDSLEPIALALERARDEWDAPAPEGESESEYTSRMARIFWPARLAGALASHQWERAVLWMEIHVGVDFAARLAGKVEALVGDVERMVRHALDSPHAAAVRHRREWLRPNANGSLPPEAKRLPPPVNPDESREPNGFEHQDLIDMTVRFAGLAYELRQLSAELHPLAGSRAAVQSGSPPPPEGSDSKATSVGAPEPAAQSTAVKLFGPSKKPTVNGREVAVLTKAQYDVVLALIEARDDGLTKDELDRQSRHGDARKIMKRLATGDDAWKAVLLFPGKTGGRYRIR